MAEAITTLHLIRRGRTADSAADLYLGKGAREAIEALRNELAAVGSGALSGKIIVRIDASAGAASSGTVVVDQSNCTAGDQLLIDVPGLPTFALVAVATDAAVGDHDGTWSIETASDDTTGGQLADAINNMAGLSLFVSASNSSGTVTITAITTGSEGDSIKIAKDVTTAGALTITAMSGGADPGARPTETVTFNTDTNALAADDTISVGAVTFTWKGGTASGENQIDYANVDADDAASFAAAVNAHSKLEGLMSASAASGVVTLTWLGDPRTAQLVTLGKAETNAGAMTLSHTAFTPDTTETYGGTAPDVHTLGAP